VLDARLGVSDKGAVCGTCGKGQKDCAGHWGHIELELPVYHIGFLRATTTVLQNICKTCSRVLLSEEDRKAAEEHLQTGMTWLEAHGDAATEEFNTEKKRVEELVRPLLMKLYGATDYSNPDGPVKHGADGPEPGPKVEEVD